MLVSGKAACFRLCSSCGKSTGLIGAVGTWSIQSDRRSDSVDFESLASFVAGMGIVLDGEAAWSIELCRAYIHEFGFSGSR